MAYILDLLILNLTLLFGICSNWAITDRQELIDIVEVVYRGASKGRGLIISPKGKCIQTSVVVILSR